MNERAAAGVSRGSLDELSGGGGAVNERAAGRGGHCSLGTLKSRMDYRDSSQSSGDWDLSRLLGE